MQAYTKILGQLASWEIV